MDNYEKKPKSMVCDFDKVCQAIEKAQKGEEIIKKYIDFFILIIYISRMAFLKSAKSG